MVLVLRIMFKIPQIQVEVEPADAVSATIVIFAEKIVNHFLTVYGIGYWVFKGGADLDFFKARRGYGAQNFPTLTIRSQAMWKVDRQGSELSAG